MDKLERAWDFLWAVVFNWKGLVAGLLLVTVSLLQLLPDEVRQRIDARFPPEWRRKALVTLCALLFVIANFQAYDEVNSKLRAEREKSGEMRNLRDRLASLEKQQRDDDKLYQNNRAVAVVVNPTVDVMRQAVSFPMLNSERELDMTKGFEFRDWKLICNGLPAGNMSFGAFRQIQYRNVLCRMLEVANACPITGHRLFAHWIMQAARRCREGLVPPEVPDATMLPMPCCSRP